MAFHCIHFYVVQGCTTRGRHAAPPGCVLRLVVKFIHYIFYTYDRIIQSVTYTGYCDVAHVQSANNFTISVVALCHRRLDTPCTLILQVIALFLRIRC